MAYLPTSKGGSCNYETSTFFSLNANTALSYNTQGRAEAIWVVVARQESVNVNVYTNVNPTTGVINNDEMYYIYLTGTSVVGWTLATGNKFIVTDSNISTQGALSGGARKVSVSYSYH